MLLDRAKAGPTVTKRSLWFHRNSCWLGDEPVGPPFSQKVSYQNAESWTQCSGNTTAKPAKPFHTKPQRSLGIRIKQGLLSGRTKISSWHQYVDH